MTKVIKLSLPHFGRNEIQWGHKLLHFCGSHRHHPSSLWIFVFLTSLLETLLGLDEGVVQDEIDMAVIGLEQ